MTKPFIGLRQQMIACGVNQADLAQVLGRAHCYVSERFNKKKPWNLDEVAKLGEYLNIPEESWVEIFLDRA